MSVLPQVQAIRSKSNNPRRTSNVLGSSPVLDWGRVIYLAVIIILPMDSDSFDELIRLAALAELAGGPMGMFELGARLQRSGVLADLQSLDDEQLALELDEILLSSDAFWTTDDGTVASTAALLNGANFSHRVTRAELELNVLDATPDLIVLDFDIEDSLFFCGWWGSQVLVRR